MCSKPAQVGRDGREKLVITSDYLELATAQDLSQLQTRLVQFAQKMDFATISAVLITEQRMGDPIFRSIGNTPPGYEEAFSALDSSRRDPVLSQIKKFSVPVLWDQRTYVQAAAGDLFEEQAPWGYKTGIAMAMHLPHGQRLLLGVDRAAPLPSSHEDITRLVADLQLVMVYAQDAAVRLLGSPKEAAITLTARETEVLKWTLEDKSAWAIGQILSISEHTVAFHIKNAMKKLNCVSKYSAAVKAGRLGLLGS